MKNKQSSNKAFILKISLLYMCLFATVFTANSQKSVATFMSYFSNFDMTGTAPLLVQMLNKWYFIAF